MLAKAKTIIRLKKTQSRNKNMPRMSELAACKEVFQWLAKNGQNKTRLHHVVYHYYANLLARSMPLREDMT